MSRRNRRDLESRDYRCECGKAYLSYPALHTHIKKYHSSPEKLLKLAVRPKREHIKRGRPTQHKAHVPNEEFEELTFIESLILKIYQQLTKAMNTAILLEGDADYEKQELNNRYQHCLRTEASSELEFVTPQQLQEYEQLLNPLAQKLIKHFTLEISVKLKVMLLVGCIYHQIEGEDQYSCISKMSSYGWGNGHLIIGEILYDVLMRALQRRHLGCQILTTNES